MESQGESPEQIWKRKAKPTDAKNSAKSNFLPKETNANTASPQSEDDNVIVAILF